MQAEDATKKLEVKSKQKEELDIQNFKDKVKTMFGGFIMIIG